MACAGYCVGNLTYCVTDRRDPTLVNLGLYWEIAVGDQDIFLTAAVACVP